jgi:hypothetical protein
MTSHEAMFSGTNWNDYEMLFFVTALRRGSIGLQFVKLSCLKGKSTAKETTEDLENPRSRKNISFKEIEDEHASMKA